MTGPGSLLRVAGVGALAANGVNNLPAYLALEPATGGRTRCGSPRCSSARQRDRSSPRGGRSRPCVVVRTRCPPVMLDVPTGTRSCVQGFFSRPSSSSCDVGAFDPLAVRAPALARDADEAISFRLSSNRRIMLLHAAATRKPAPRRRLRTHGDPERSPDRHGVAHDDVPCGRTLGQQRRPAARSRIPTSADRLPAGLADVADGVPRLELSGQRSSVCSAVRPCRPPKLASWKVASVRTGRPSLSAMIAPVIWVRTIGER